jgi:Flp pilus assembly protein TadG
MATMDRFRNCRGQSLPIVVLCMFSLIGIAGGAIDVGSWLHARQSLQAAADAAALAGASQLPSGWGSAQSAAAAEFAKNDAAGDSATYSNTSYLSANDSVKVTATRSAPAFFAKVFGLSSIRVTSTAQATIESYQTVTSNHDVMPWGVMKGSYTPGQTYSIYSDNSSSNNGALSLPYVNSVNCPVPNGASSYRDEIDGDLNACPVSVGEHLDVKPGQNAGPTRQGIDTRITSWEPLAQIVQFGANGQVTLLDPNSKQLVLIPIVEDANGGTNWQNGSGWVRVVGFAWFVITPAPGYTDNGKAVTGVFVGLQDTASTGDVTGAYDASSGTAYTVALTQ